MGSTSGFLWRLMPSIADPAPPNKDPLVSDTRLAALRLGGRAMGCGAGAVMPAAATSADALIAARCDHVSGPDRWVVSPADRRAWACD